MYLERLKVHMKHCFMKESLENSSVTELLVEEITKETQNDWEKKILERGGIHSKVLKDWYIQTANCCVYPHT